MDNPEEIVEGGLGEHLSAITQVPLGVGSLRSSRSDVRMLRKAIKENWPITREERERAIERLAELAESEDPRYALTALSTLIAADGVNVREKARRDEKRRAKGGQNGTTVNVNILNMTPAELAQKTPDELIRIHRQQIELRQREGRPGNAGD